MRAVVVACLTLAACGGTDQGNQCSTDSDCSGGEICARDEVCWPSDDVRAVKVTWTFAGQPASAATCSATPNLFVYFSNDEATFGFEPVPCAAGVFPIDRLETEYTSVELGDELGSFDLYGAFDATGQAAFDIAP